MGGGPGGVVARKERRSCLWCGKGFLSTGAGHRKCPDCRRRESSNAAKGCRYGRMAFEAAVNTRGEE